MPGAILQSSDMADLQAMTHRHEGRMRFQQIAQELQEYEVVGKLLKKDRVIFLTGRGIQRTLMVKLANSVRHQGLLDEDQPNLVDLLAQIQVDWVLASGNYGWLETEMAENSGREMILNVMVPRRKGVMIDMAAEMEDKFFSAPDANSAVNPYGLKYWIVQSATEGFEGSYPSGFTDMAGLNLTTYPKFKNWCGTYQTFSKTGQGIVRIMRKMHRKTGFRSPVDIPDYRQGKGSRYRYYANEKTMDQWEMMLEESNDNLGVDLAPFDGNAMVFKKHPLIWIPTLDSDTANPVYAIDTSTFYTAVLRGFYMRETSPIRAPKQHLGWYVPVDLRYNWINVDRRRSGVIYQV